MDRVFLLNPGQSLDVGDRTLQAVRPPLFDSPTTVGCFDDRSRTLFSSDCFGGPMPTAELATGASVADLDPDELRARQMLWASVDSPWVHLVDRLAFEATVAAIGALDPSRILSTHLPSAAGHVGELLDTIRATPDAMPFVGPDQAALERTA
jgi:hypothetical protein